MSLRIGYGYDVHQLAEGEDLVIGGLTIPHHKGSVGHSDADVLLHVICDAMLGALALGDIGTHFPDTDPAYKGIDSKILLRDTWKMVQAQGYGLANLDSRCVCSSPNSSRTSPPCVSALQTFWVSMWDRWASKPPPLKSLDLWG